jgi:hypothetical protein
MESRMLGNLHVRFGAGDEETCLGDEVRRFIPTLPKSSAALSLEEGDAMRLERRASTRPMATQCRFSINPDV